MSKIIIGNKNVIFSWLPNYLVNHPKFSAEALAAALYLNGKSEGWIARPADIQKRFGWGDHTWRKVSKELREFKLLHVISTANGRSLMFEIQENEAPALEPQPTVDFRTMRKSHHAKNDVYTKERIPTKQRVANTKETQPVCVDLEALSAKANMLKVSPKALESLVKKYGFALVGQYLAMLEKQNEVRNPTGWLKAALKESWQPSEATNKAAPDSSPDIQETIDRLNASQVVRSDKETAKQRLNAIKGKLRTGK